MAPAGNPTTRRSFLATAAAAAASPALESLAAMTPASQPSAVAPPHPVAPRGIRSLRLHTHRLDALRTYYPRRLGLPMVAETKDSATFRIGATDLTFAVAAQGEPCYHFAFNIPENRLDAAMEWIRPISPLLKRPDGSEVYHFESWNAHSVYFLDPAGNLLELIARHSLKNAATSAFDGRSLLNVSEIGVVVDRVADTVASADAHLGMGVFAGSLGPKFAALGDDHGLLIVVEKGRAWNSIELPARVFPTTVELCGDRAARLPTAAFPYEIAMMRA